MRRRDFIRFSLAGTGFVLTGCASPGADQQAVGTEEAGRLVAAKAAGGAGSVPGGLLADAWQKQAFESTSVEEAIKSLYGAMMPVESNAIKLEIPVFAESALMVPVSVSTNLQQVQAIHLLVKDNQMPLVASFEIPPGGRPSVSTRVVVERSSDVIAVVKAGGKLYTTRVDVIVGSMDGCVTHKVGA